MSTEMIIDTEYNGYVFVGWAAGRFQADRGEMMPNGLEPGDRVKLFFDDKKRVVMAASD